jgi:hypothetical protein
MINEKPQEYSKMNKSHLFCPLNGSQPEISFSLVDYRNNYFTSNDLNKIIEFYKSFDNNDQLIQWIKERPKGIANIHEVDGDKDIIVVIPTADFDGKYAKNCRENIFTGLHIIFVESGEYPDPYFNYAHNCNIGIRRAMEYNPRWVVVSNDDMYKIDDISKLADLLNKLYNNLISAVFAHPSSYHSRLEIVGEINIFAHLYYKRSKSSRILRDLKKRFKVRFANAPDTLLARLFFKRYVHIREFIDFGIYSSNLIKEWSFTIYDEVFINHFEDTDLALRITQERKSTVLSDYNIGTIGAATLGNNSLRDIRAIASLAYFSSKHQTSVNEPR